MVTTRICLWSGPRNVSTALMYSFSRRPDTKVIDEPLYGYYLKAFDVDHPGREEVLQHMSADGKHVIDDIILGNYEQPVLFIKNMAHHCYGLPDDFLSGLRNIFLIRDPREMLPSLIKQLPRPVIRDTGLPVQWQLFKNLKGKGKAPLVVDASVLLENPEKILRKICKTLEIAFFSNMLHWPAGPAEADGVWARYWYHSVHASTGFHPYSKKDEKVPPALEPLLQECLVYYNKLKEYATH